MRSFVAISDAIQRLNHNRDLNEDYLNYRNIFLWAQVNSWRPLEKVCLLGETLSSWCPTVQQYTSFTQPSLPHPRRTWAFLLAQSCTMLSCCCCLGWKVGLIQQNYDLSYKLTLSYYLEVTILQHFLCNGIRWHLFSYLHHNSQFLIII